MFNEMKTVRYGSNCIGCYTAIGACTTDFTGGKHDSANCCDAECIRYVALHNKVIQFYVVIRNLLFPVYNGSWVTENRTCQSYCSAHDNLIAFYITSHLDYW